MIRRATIILTGLAIVFAFASTAPAGILMSDNFDDGDYTTGPTWTINPGGGGTWATAPHGTGSSLNITNPANLGTFNYGPAQHWIQTTFPEVSLLEFELSLYTGFLSGLTHNNNAIGVAVLDAAGQNGYMAEFTRNTASSWFGHNIRRMVGGTENAHGF